MAAEKLFTIRPIFVENVSRNVIQQLLDDLLRKKVLNDGEVDEVKEEYRQRADQARFMIDMVRRKGDNASQLMIQHLQHRDPELSKRLGFVDQYEDEPMLQDQLC